MTTSYRLLMDPKTGRVIGSIPATGGVVNSAGQVVQPQTVNLTASPVVAATVRTALSPATAAAGQQGGWVSLTATPQVPYLPSLL